MCINYFNSKYGKACFVKIVALLLICRFKDSNESERYSFKNIYYTSTPLKQKYIELRSNLRPYRDNSGFSTEFGIPGRLFLGPLMCTHKGFNLFESV